MTGFRVLKAPRRFDYPRAALDRLDRRFAPRLARHVLGAVAALREPSPEHLADLLSRGGVEAVVDAFPWTQFHATLSTAIQPVVAMAMAAAGRTLTPHTTRVRKDDTGGLHGSFGLINPRAVEAARAATYELVTGLTNESRAAVRDIITRTLSGEYSADRAAMLLRQVVGLNAPQAGALLNFEAGLVDAGEDPARIQTLVERQSAHAVKYRADMVARTEIIRASNAGQQEIWQQMADDGTISDNAQREWIASPDACPECADLDGQTVGLDEEFADGVLYPPYHPNCRCSVALSDGSVDEGDG